VNIKKRINLHGAMVAVFTILCCNSSHAMMLALKKHANQYGKYSAQYHFNISKLDKNRTIYEKIIINEKLLDGKKYKSNSSFCNHENNTILAEFGFGGLDDYRENLALHLLENLDAIVEIYDKFLHHEWHSTHVLKSYNGAFANLADHNRLASNVELIMKTAVDECPEILSEDWKNLRDAFIELFEDSSKFRILLNNSETQRFIEHFIKIALPIKKEPRKHNMKFLNCAIDFPTRANIPRDLSGRTIPDLVRRVENLSLVVIRAIYSDVFQNQSPRTYSVVRAPKSSVPMRIKSAP